MEQMLICKEQQGFRKNRSTIDAIFILRQIVGKSIEYDKPAFMCFIDMTKAFDRVSLNDVTDIMREAGIPEEIVRIVEALNSKTTTQILANDILTEEIAVSIGIRQGDSLSLLLFNMIMDKIIKEVRKAGRGYETDKGEVRILCYADDAVILS